MYCVSFIEYVWDCSLKHSEPKLRNLPYDEIKINQDVKLIDFLNRSDESDIGYFDEVDLKHRDEIKEKQNVLYFVLGMDLVVKIILVNI